MNLAIYLLGALAGAYLGYRYGNWKRAKRDKARRDWLAAKIVDLRSERGLDRMFLDEFGRLQDEHEKLQRFHEDLVEQAREMAFELNEYRQEESEKRQWN